ncbi:MAG: sensor histidine kinase [Candidatus Binataceae bacterium]
MSIRLRLTIYWALVLGAILLIAAFAALKLFEREQYGALHAALVEEADTSSHELSLADKPRAAALLRGLSLERDLGPRRRVVLVTSSGVVADFGAQSVQLPKISVASKFRGISRVARDNFSFAIKPLVFAGENALLMDGADVAPIRESVDRLRTTLLLVVPSLLILCVAGGYLLAGRALAPVASLAAALADITPHDLNRRLTAPEAYDEIGRLTDVINALLDRLESASVTERRFASDAAHELRTPLAVLRTGLDVALARERSAAENRAALENAHREVIGLCKIAEELLMLTRLSGEVAIERGPVDLRALVAEVIATVEALAAGKNVELHTAELASAIIEGSATHLRRLVINLIDNALKFTPAGGRIEIGLVNLDGRAILRVADTGPGIETAELPLIFERFFRGAHAGGEGSGLGLSLCREIARYHGGQIAAANRPGGGAVFAVKLPLRGTRALQPAESAQLTASAQVA